MSRAFILSAWYQLIYNFALLLEQKYEHAFNASETWQLFVKYNVGHTVVRYMII